MSENEKTISEAAYFELAKDTLAGRREAFKQFDQAVLTLSSGAFVLSVAFLKDIAPPGQAAFLCLLILSWIGFFLAIVSTIISFLLVPIASEQQLEIAAKFYLEQDGSYEKLIAPASKWIQSFNATSAVSFVLALLLTCVFAISNISR